MFGFFDKYFLFFGLEIYYYGLIIAIAMAIGVFVAIKNAKLRGLNTDDIIIIACYVLPIAIIGARVYYCIFSADKFYSFWDYFKIWDGGLAVYGSVIGGAIGVVLYCLIHKKNFFDVADIAVPTLILGQAIGRIGCYFSGCCYGVEVSDPSLQWFPLSTMIDSHWHLSTFFYESLWNLIGFVILMLLLRIVKVKTRGVISASYLIYYGIGRAWIEGLRGDSLYIGSIKVSQLLSIILIVVGLGILLYFYLKKERHPYFGQGGQTQELSLTSGSNLAKKDKNLGKKKKDKK